MFTCVAQYDISIKTSTSLAVSAQASRIFISNFHNDCVDIFGLDGTFVGVIGDEESAKFKFPGKLYVDDASDQLFVPDSGNHRVQVFNLKGQYQRNIRTAKHPRSVCCSIGGHKIFVSGGGLYDLGWFAVYDGQSGKKISEHSDVQLGSYVSGIAYNNTTHEVFVSDFTNCCVVVLDENGKFKRTFGKNGSKEFDRPCQLSIDEASGLLFITGHNRAQVVWCSDGSLFYNINHPSLKSSYYDANSQRVYIIDDSYLNIFVKTRNKKSHNP